MDYVYNGANIPPSQFVIGVDPAMGNDRNIVIGREYGELSHPDSSDDRIYAMSRGIAALNVNLDLTLLDDNLAI